MKKVKWVIMVFLFACILLLVVLVVKRSHRQIDGTKLIDEVKNMNDEKIMLVDYCKHTVATVGGDGYRETVLYQNRDGSTEVHYFSKYEDDTGESHSFYPVDSAIIDEVYGIINEKHLIDWKKHYSGIGPEGAIYTLKFRIDGGKFVQMSSDEMNDDGLKVITAISVCMDRYVSESE